MRGAGVAMLATAVLGASGCGGVSIRTDAPRTVIGTVPAEVAAAPVGAAPTATTPSAATPAVAAVDNLFEPEVLTASAGSEVVWRNDGAIEHNIRPVDTSEPFGVELADFPPGATYAHLFDAPGTYRYYCTIHGTQDRGMIGTIEITA